jgi:MFS family permease
MTVLAAGVVTVAAAGIEVEPLSSALLAASGLALIGMFLWLDGHAGPGRLLPFRPWDPRAVQGTVMILLLFLSAATSGLITYGPLLMTRLHDLAAVEIGLIMLLESVGWSLTAILISGLPRRFEGLAIAGGFGAVTLGVAGLTYAMVAGPIWLIAFFALIQGAGFGAAWSFLVRRTLVIVAPGERERTASAIPTVQRLGYALGSAFVGIIANATGFADDASAQAAAHSSHWIFALSLVLAGVGMAGVWRFLKFREPPAGGAA